MHAAWYTLLGLMMTTYAVLDGFDFGAGMVHLFVARTDEERRSVLAAIGPWWDGNEVWLIAAGGSFFFAFPRAYAAAFSGLYLPLMMVLWLLVLRGMAIELRSMSDNALWRTAWDVTFAGSSTVMAAVLGVAIGNLVRGLPVDETGYFREDLFASGTGARAGAIDPFTSVYGAFALATLGAHGATFLVWKTSGELAVRARAAAWWLWVITVALAVLATAITAFARPAFFAHLGDRPWLLPLPLVAIASAVVALRSVRKHHELRSPRASSSRRCFWPRRARCTRSFCGQRSTGRSPSTRTTPRPMSRASSRGCWSACLPSPLPSDISAICFDRSRERRRLAHTTNCRRSLARAGGMGG